MEPPLSHPRKHEKSRKYLVAARAAVSDAVERLLRLIAHGDTPS